MTHGYSLEKDYFQKLTIYYKVWSKVLGDKEFDSPSHFLKFVTLIFSLEKGYNTLPKMKIQGSQISRNNSENRIPHPRKSLIELCNIPLVFENSLSLVKIEGPQIFRYTEKVIIWKEKMICVCRKGVLKLIFLNFTLLIFYAKKILKTWF
jgi:hypothetical protein